jgi:hypothetical protein
MRGARGSALVLEVSQMIRYCARDAGDQQLRVSESRECNEGGDGELCACVHHDAIASRVQ